MSRRADSYPAPAEKQILEGRSLPSPSPRYELAAEIRRLNAALGALPAAAQAEIQPDWLASYDELTRQRAAARDADDELDAIAEWASHWKKRLGVRRR